MPLRYCNSDHQIFTSSLPSLACCSVHPRYYLQFDSTDTRSWDDWVEEDRLRKLTPENRELANSLKHAVLEQQRAARAQAQPTKKKQQTSTRGSEERQTPVQAAQPRGQKRMRDQDLEKVSVRYDVLESASASYLDCCDTN